MKPELLEVKPIKESQTINDNLIELSDVVYKTPNDNINNLLSSDMIDLNSNPNSERREVVLNDICDSPTKKLISDIGTRLFESILEPILYPGETYLNDNDLSCLEKTMNNYVQSETNINLDNRNVGLKNEDNFNCSTNSLVSENLSSPMQTSTDNMIDSELASNDSQSPKSIQNINSNVADMQTNQHNFNYGHSLLEIKKFNEFCSSYDKPRLYSSNDTFSNPKSDQSLLNSAESCDSSPVHKVNKDYIPRKTSKKLKSKKNFGVKTLQAIFGNKNDGYSDISSTNSDFGDDNVFIDNNKLPGLLQVIPKENKQTDQQKKVQRQQDMQKFENLRQINLNNNKHEDMANNALNAELSRLLAKPILTEISPQFEKNIHTFLSETFDNKKPRQSNPEVTLPNFTVSNIGNKKYFMLHGQNLRVGKALRLCPNEEVVGKSGECSMNGEQKLSQKEKLLARYVYNTNSINVDGVGDPDFGTPV